MCLLVNMIWWYLEQYIGGSEDRGEQLLVHYSQRRCIYVHVVTNDTTEILFYALPVPVC